MRLLHSELGEAKEQGIHLAGLIGSVVLDRMIPVAGDPFKVTLQRGDEQLQAAEDVVAIRAPRSPERL